MNRRVILLGAGIVLVVAIVLAIKVNRSDSSTRSPSTPDPTTDPSSSSSSSSTQVSADRTKPALDPKSGDQPVASDYVETEVDGVKVRDHRKKPGEPFQMPPTIRQHGPERLPSNLVGMLSNSLQSAMKECTASITADSKGKYPALEAELFVDIKDKKLTITSSTAKLSDVTGETAAVKQCFEQKSVGNVLPAGSQADGSHYEITLSYHLQK